MVGAVVFDLDTLLDISALSKERRRARWDEMRSRLDEVAPYPKSRGSMPPIELVRRAHAGGARVGVVTDLPRPIARGLAEKFQVSCNRLIDASQGFPVGPQPEVLEEMSERLGVGSAETIVVGSSKPVFGAAANSGARSAGVSWAGTGLEGWSGAQPDVRLRDPDDVAAALDSASAMRPVAEVLADGAEPSAHWGSLIEVREGVFAAGRYFSSTDRRLSAHGLSGLIIRAKANRGPAGRLGEVLGEAAKLTEMGADLVVSVPGKPGADFDRFGVARARVAESLGAKDGRGVLEMIRDCENYIDLDRDQRRTVNHGRFCATRELNGETVVLIDDVITSGSQTRACERELLGAGAGEVWTLVAAATQDPIQRACPKCGEGVMRRVFGHTGPFYACTKFKCNNTEPWDG